MYISYERKSEKNLLTFFVFCLHKFYFCFLSPRLSLLIRTFGSSGSSVLTQGYRSDCHQAPTAAPCLVLAFLVKQKLLRPLLRSRLRYWFGASESIWEESQSIHSCQSHFTCFCFFIAMSFAILNITVLPACTSWYPLLGWIPSIVLLGSSDNSMFSFFQNLQAIFQNDCNTIYSH
jgi:hypothetical protein